MRKIITLVLLAFSLSISAQESKSISLYDGSEMFLFGVGALDSLGEDIYLGALYLPSFDYELGPEISKRLEMRVASETLSTRKFTRLWMEAITINSSLEERNQQTQKIQKFSSLFQTGMVAGDHVSFDYIAGDKKTVFIVNKMVIGEIRGSEFFDILLQSWIGETPFSAKFKSGVLNKLSHEELASNQEKYNAFEFTDEKLREIEQAKELAQRQKQQEMDRFAALALEKEQAEAAEKAAEELRIQRMLENQARIAEANRLRLEQQAEQERLAKQKEIFEAEQAKLGNSHVRLLTGWVGKYLEYPKVALRQEHEGRVEVIIVTDRNGQLLESRIVESSNSTLLDNGALEIVANSSPLPEMPENLEGEKFTFLMPFNFLLDN